MPEQSPNYSTLADTVACVMTETTEVPIPDALTPELDELLMEWLTRHNLRGSKPLDRFVQRGPSDGHWSYVSAEDWRKIEASAA